jgi:hypothetical protein
MEIMIGFGGVILGFIMSEIATWLRQRSSEKQQAQATRILLSLEIENNLQLLRSFWERVGKAGAEAKDRRTASWRTANTIADLPLPNWSHRAWESQLGVLPQALGSNTLLREVHAHHAQLDAIAAIRDKIAVLRQTQQADWHARQDSTGAVKSMAGLDRSFDENAPSLCAECERIVKETLNIGNPIPQKMTTL